MGALIEGIRVISLSPGTCNQERPCGHKMRRHLSESQETLTKNQISQHLDLGHLNLHNSEKMDFLLIKLPSLWHFVLAAEANTQRLKARNLDPYFLSLPETQRR